MTATERVASGLMWCVAIMALLFLLTPLIVTVLVSFGSSAVFNLPPPGWSLVWYEKLLTLRGLGPSLFVSLQVAAVSTVVSLTLGSLCAVGLVRSRMAGRETIAAFLVSPLMLPGLVLGIAMLQAFRMAGLRDVGWSLMIAHVVITIPYVMRTMVAAISLLDFGLVDAARTLGCSYAAAVRRVLVPLLAPALVASGLFSFLASLDNYAVSIFFTDAWTKTLPIQILQYVEEQPDPTIAAISTVLIAFTLLALFVCERVVGLGRMIDF